MTLSKELYLVASFYDHIIIDNPPVMKIPVPEGVKILYAFESKEEARKMAKKLKVKMITLKTDKFFSGENN